MEETQQAQLDVELELIESSLLPNENLAKISQNPYVIDITSTDSKLALHITINDAYPAPGSIGVEVKGPEIGRGEAEGWKIWVLERLKDWDSDEEWVIHESCLGRAGLISVIHSFRSLLPTSFLFSHLPLLLVQHHHRPRPILQTRARLNPTTPS